MQRENKIVVRSFSDGTYGGKRKALKAAIDCRDFLLAEYSAVKHQIWGRTRLRKNNTSRSPGVARYEVLANPKTGRREAFWLASWVDEHGASRKRKFHVSLRGERQAKRLAIAERQRQLKHRLKTRVGRAAYALRKQTVEPVFGIIKSVIGFRQFLLRGLDNVKNEWKLVCLAWNLKRMAVLRPQ